MTTQQLQMLMIPSTPPFGAQGHQTGTRAGSEYPKSLVHGDQTALVTRPPVHILPTSWGDGSPSTWATIDSNIKQLVCHMCSRSASLGPFWHETILTIATMVRFHSFLVWIYLHNTGYDHATTLNVGGTINASIWGPRAPNWYFQGYVGRRGPHLRFLKVSPRVWHGSIC